MHPMHPMHAMVRGVVVLPGLALGRQISGSEAVRAIAIKGFARQ
ncbi:hypothetical protein [Labrenzia sp. 011]|nr:hypothetical protein [Labrenzia sp. 011]